MKRVLLAVIAVVLLAGCGGAPGVRVLFVGNSFTHLHDMPGMMERIAPDNGTAVEVEMIAPPGALLADHLADPDVLTALSGGEFDVVVVQEQSELPAHTQMFRDSTMPSAATLARLAHDGGARLVWFQTWAHLWGNEFTGHDGFTAMQAEIVRSYDELAIANGGTVARVGEAFDRSLSTDPSIRLHDTDGRHSSEAGSYLAALVITEQVIGRSVDDAPSLAGVDGQTADQLLSSA